MDPSSHYLRLRVVTNGQMLYYVPKPEEDISDLVRRSTKELMSLKACLSCLLVFVFFGGKSLGSTKDPSLETKGSPLDIELN